jgi:hypothetical protein
MADEMGLTLRGYQDNENSEEELRLRHKIRQKE